MAWYNPKTWGKNKVEVVEPETEKIVESDFSTDLTASRNQKSANLNNWIVQNLFQVTADDIVPVEMDGVVMDSVAMDSSSIKSAFELGDTGNLSAVLFSWYVRQGFIGYQACSIIAQNWLVDKACTKPARKALKKGYELTVNDGSDVDPKLLKDMRRLDRRYKIKRHLVDFERKSRIFGIRVAVFHVKSNDPEYYSKPFNIDGVKKGSYKGISQLDPYWISPELDLESTSDPSSMHFYEPTWWRINGKRYHRSHLIINRYSETTDILKPSYIYGGIPLPQMIYERVYAAERTANEGPLLALTKRVNIIKTNIKAALAKQASFEERLALFNTFRDNHGIFAIDKEEEYQQTDTSLADLDDVIMTQYQLVAAVAGMPADELLETAPKGFNATGDFQKETWYDSLECIQEDSYSPLLERHYEILQKSLATKEFGFDITWLPLDTPTPKEVAEINEINARADISLVDVGAVDNFEVRDRIIKDPHSGYNGLLPYSEEEKGELSDEGVEE